MKRRAVLFMMAQLVTLSTTRLIAQGTPGTNVDVDVTVVSVQVTGGRVLLSYVVRNRPSSAERLFELTIPVPQGVQSVSADAPQDSWLTMSRYRGRPVAQWGALGDQMQPGDSSPTLSYTAFGVLGITPAWVRGYVPPTPLPPEDTTNRVFHQEADPVFGQGKAISVVGIVPAPSGGSAGAIELLSEQVSYSCGGAGWIAPMGICNSLAAKLSAASASLARNDPQSARGSLAALIDELDAQRGKHIAENAYWLLKTNSTYAMAHL